MKRLFVAVAALGLMGAAPDGRSIAVHGNDNGALPCAACHGQDFHGNAGIGAPALAGMPAASIVARLDMYANTPAASATMHRIAVALSPAERAAVAAYLAGLPKP